ncbi:MAG: M15 family metallopeptidase [Egibacteraceae bacterium]
MPSLFTVLALCACLALAACAESAPAVDPVARQDAAAPDRADVPDGAAAPDGAALDRAAGEGATPDPATGPGAGPSAVVAARPLWLGTRVLPLRPDGFGEIQPTPPELDDRRLPPPADDLPPPGEAFAATVETVPGAVAARSTWSPACPVALEDLRYLTVTFWGFDARPHTGELLVHERVADAMVDVFRAIYDARFPIEEMRVITAADLDAPATGDGNTTTAFVCRSTVSSGSWSQHAYGLAVDINPFHNPYARDDVVVPELASAYVDRGRHRPGMIQPGDAVTQAFATLGWPWGGEWRSAKDWMHFSHNGR